MRKHTRSINTWKLAGICLVALGTFAAFGDPPSTINLRGQLLDAQGHALSGAREYSVQFYDAASGGNGLGTAITGTTEVSIEGLFNVTVPLPASALTVTEVWYELAISSSTTPSPLAVADAFPNRVKVESVPFAIEAAEAGHVDVAAVGSGTVTNSEFEALSGVTSGIQDQLDAKAAATDVYTKTEVDTAQGVQDVAIAAKANSADVYTKSEVDAAKVAKTGDTMTGALTVHGSYVGIGQATAPSPVDDKLYNVGGTLQWNGNPAYRFPWTTVTTDTQMAGNNGYVVDSDTAMVSLTLPASSSLNVGDTVRVNGLGAAGWKITQAASQSIVLEPLDIPNYKGTWTARMTDTVREWHGAASSADGTKLVATANGLLCTSSDSGTTWITRDSSHNWLDVASSADGAKLVAGEGPGHLWRSADSGATWTEITSSPPGSGVWYSVAMSADGAKVVASSLSEGVYLSTDSGLTWSEKNFLEIVMDPRWIEYVASSADGTTLMAGEGDGYLWTSTDSGATWTSHYTDGNRNWVQLAMSADGRKMVASEYWSHHYTSLDRGATWLDHVYQGNRYWCSLALSADATRVLASAGSSNTLYTSTNACATWEAAFSSGQWPGGVAVSSDGTNVVLGTLNGYLYTYGYGGTLAASTPGTSGYLAGGENSAVELQYVGNDTFVPVSSVGSLGAN